MTTEAKVRAVVRARFKDESVSPAVPRTVGEVLVLDESRARRWADRKLVTVLRDDAADVDEGWPWSVLQGRELLVEPRPAGSWERVVVVLNVWNDRADLEVTMPQWLDHVDHVIAVDGAYLGVPVTTPQSTDGTLEFLRGFGDKVTIIEAPGFWPDQVVKRSQYFEHGRPGDVFIQLDADEILKGAETFRSLPDLDVGWFMYTSPLYTRAQAIPRVWRWVPGLHYHERHHWVYVTDGTSRRLVSTNQLGGAGFDHAMLPVRMENTRGIRRPATRQHARDIHRRHQYTLEMAVGADSPVRREPLRIAQLSRIEPGNAVYRLHSAINTTTPHTSVMATADDGMFASPRQFDLKEEREIMRRALSEADVVHMHLDLYNLDELGVRTNVPIVLHHHGTVFRRASPGLRAQWAARAAVQLVSNPELLQYGDGLLYLPNPVPVAAYRRMANAAQATRTDGVFRIAHSPTKPEIKGTEHLLAVVRRLQQRGLPVDVVLIHGVSHREALRLRATCDATFDSFWLGMQCSGLEGAAMGQMVLAGDEDVRQAFTAWYGECPYTYTPDAAALERAIERAVMDGDWHTTESERVGAFVEQHHDYAAVAARYLDILDHRLGWRALKTRPEAI